MSSLSLSANRNTQKGGIFKCESLINQSVFMTNQ